MTEKKKYTEEELNMILDGIGGSVGNIKEFIDSMYTNLLFLGKSALAYSKNTDAISSNIQLCQAYYLRVEEYEKLAKLSNMLKTIDEPDKAIVSSEVINLIEVNLN